VFAATGEIGDAACPESTEADDLSKVEDDDVDMEEAWDCPTHGFRRGWRRSGNRTSALESHRPWAKAVGAVGAAGTGALVVAGESAGGTYPEVLMGGGAAAAATGAAATTGGGEGGVGGGLAVRRVVTGPGDVRSSSWRSSSSMRN